MRPKLCRMAFNSWQKSCNPNIYIYALDISQGFSLKGPLDNMHISTIYESQLIHLFVFNFETSHYQDGRVVKALDLSSNGRVVRVGSNPTSGKDAPFNSSVVTSRFSV